MHNTFSNKNLSFFNFVDVTEEVQLNLAYSVGVLMILLCSYFQVCTPLSSFAYSYPQAINRSFQKSCSILHKEQRTMTE